MQSTNVESNEDPLPCLRKLRELLLESIAKDPDSSGAYEFEKQLAATDLLIQKIEERRKKNSCKA